MRIPRDLQDLSPRPRSDAAPEGDAAFAVAPPRSRLASVARALAGFVVGVLVAGGGAAVGLARYGGAYDKSPLRSDEISTADLSDVRRPVDEEIEVRERRLERFAPGRETYVVVDSYANRLRVYRRGELVREAICSTGSGVRLVDPRDGREWVFDTPQGELRILRKVKNPVWVKPDWAFIEEGMEPPRGMRARIDDYSLGEYGLYMRDGYIIHGTVFKTLLGKRVTHGCIRLGDEDLEFVYKNVPAGARVFLY